MPQELLDELKRVEARRSFDCVIVARRREWNSRELFSYVPYANIGSLEGMIDFTPETLAMPADRFVGLLVELLKSTGSAPAYRDAGAAPSAVSGELASERRRGN
jgi:hypothetical protein